MVDSLRDAYQQLEALRQKRSASNPELYRDLALYLQVLRDGLLNSVQRACFVLATEVYPDRYQAMEAHQRQHLHRRLRTLVRRACSLLTVEQLAQLAAQQARERIAERHHRHRQWLEGLGADQPSTRDGDVEPAGSIQLGLHPPIDLVAGDSPLMAKLLLADSDAAAPPEEPPAEALMAQQPGPGSGAHLTVSEQDLMASGLMEAFSTAVEHLEQFPAPTADGMGQSSTPAPWDQGLLPREPGALLVWLDGVEDALARRLRNLSHAINVELLRLGLSRSLLPLSLLEAASHDRLELQEAPANLIRLPVTGLEAVALLLRPTDLEQVLPPLRTCRSRWRQHRLEVRRMAEISRRLQRRVQVLEAEQLWLQDIASTPTSRSS
jgi:hypothetical protein